MKGWEAAAHGWIAMVDSNVLMPRDYIEQLLSRADRETAMVSAPPVGSYPEGVWAELECAFLNPYQARWQLAADAFGFGFAHGKNMLWRRDVLDAPAASARSRQSRRRTRPAPRSCARRA